MRGRNVSFQGKEYEMKKSSTTFLTLALLLAFITLSLHGSPWGPMIDPNGLELAWGYMIGPVCLEVAGLELTSGFVIDQSSLTPTMGPWIDPHGIRST